MFKMFILLGTYTLSDCQYFVETFLSSMLKYYLK